MWLPSHRHRLAPFALSINDQHCGRQRHLWSQILPLTLKCFSILPTVFVCSGVRKRKAIGRMECRILLSRTEPIGFHAIYFDKPFLTLPVSLRNFKFRIKAAQILPIGKRFTLLNVCNFLAKMQSFKCHTFAQVSTTKFVFLIQWFRTEIFENVCWFKVYNTDVSAWSLSTDLLWAVPAVDRNRSSAVKKLNQLLPKSCHWHGTIYDPESITLVLKKLLLRLGDQTHAKSTLSQYSSPLEVKL